MILQIILSCFFFAMSIYMFYIGHTDTVYFVAFLFLSLDNLTKSARIQLLELAVLKEKGKLPDELNNFEIEVNIKRK